MSQTTYNQNPDIGEEGEIASNSQYQDVVSAIADDTNDPILFGSFVTVKTAPAGGDLPVVELPNASGEVTGVAGQAGGVVVRDKTAENSNASAFTGYVDGEILSIMRRGRIWVISEDAVSAVGVAAFVRYTKEAPDIVLGKFRTDDDSSKAVALPGARFLTTCDAGGLVLLELSPQTA